MKLNEIYKEYSNNFAEGKMPYLKCSHCGNIFYYPRNNCHICGYSSIEIMQSSGKGEIYSYTEFNSKYYGIIRFNDGFRAYMDIHGKDPAIGNKISVKFKDFNGNILPYAEIEN